MSEPDDIPDPPIWLTPRKIGLDHEALLLDAVLAVYQPKDKAEPRAPLQPMKGWPFDG